MFLLMSTRYTDLGINTISHVEIFKGTHTVKDSQKRIYHLRLDYNNESSAWQTMEYFLEHVIHTINNKFVMIISGEDLTFPNQIDYRWKDNYQLNLIKKTYNSIIDHPLLLHCFIENRDEIHPNTSSIPLGINPREMPNMNCDYIMKYMGKNTSLKERMLKVICIHRHRKGDREIIDSYKNKDWKNFTITGGNYKTDSWYTLLQTYPFIICAHGGGIDPCPKIWEALCVGCIPIIKSSALNDVYSQFPVVILDEWSSNTIILENLNTWLVKYSDFYDNNELRQTWIHKLFADYWKNLIHSHLQ
jgi:hypothetical protein